MAPSRAAQGRAWSLRAGAATTTEAGLGQEHVAAMGVGILPQTRPPPTQDEPQGTGTLHVLVGDRPLLGLSFGGAAGAWTVSPTTSH